MSDPRFTAASAASRILVDPLLGSIRFQVRDQHHLDRLRAANRTVIFVLWHGRLLPLTYYHRGRGIATIISASSDGELIARVVERWDYAVVRGSSSRGGGAALRGLVSHARRGRDLAITPDGPRGPRQRMKPGALTAARLTGMPLLPLAAGCDRAWWFEGWDRFLVPKPFATVRIAYGRPYDVPRDADEARLGEIAADVEAELNRLVEETDAGVGFD